LDNIINGREDVFMKDKKNKGPRKKPTVAPGLTDEVLGEPATREDIKKGNYTRVTRVYLDENDPS